MAVPKRKTSQSRRDMRKANWRLSVPGFSTCPKCKQLKLPHIVCKECGFYKGKDILNKDVV